MNILIISRDSSVLCKESDTALRHILYAKRLWEQYQGKIFMIVYIHKNISNRASSGQYLEHNLYVIPTCSYNKFFYIFDLIKRSFSILKKEKIDIITTQTPFEDALIAYLFAKLFSKKLLIQVHADFFSKYFLEENILINSMRLIISLFTLRGADAIRVVSDRVKEKISRLTNKKIFINPVMVSMKPSIINKQEARQFLCNYFNHIHNLDEKYLILFVGRLTYQKNLPMLIRCAAELSKLSASGEKNLDFLFLVIGSGPQLNRLKNLIKKYRLEKKVILLGQIEYKKLNNFYRAADVLILPSLYEGFGRVIVEAYLNELVVVAANCSGLPSDIIIHKETGFLVPPNDHIMMANYIYFLATNPEVAKNMATAGKIYVEKKFAPSLLVDELINIWHRVLK